MIDFICICCPKGCHISVDENNNYEVTGNSCPRGAEYAKTEAISPVRVVTSSVHITNASTEKCPVKTDKAIPKEKIFDIMHAIRTVRLNTPVNIGDVLIEDVCGTGANVIATRKCPAIIR